MSNYIDTLKETIISDVYYHHEVLNNVDIHTVGCELSEWDGEQLANGISEPAILLNTCAVTEYSQIASEYLADILSKLYPEKKLYITGCGVNYNKEYYSKLGIALDNSEKFEICKPKTEIKANRLLTGHGTGSFLVYGVIKRPSMLVRILFARSKRKNTSAKRKHKCQY